MLKDFDEHGVWVEFLEFSNLLKNAALDMMEFDEDYMPAWFLVTNGLSQLVAAHTERVESGETDGVFEDEVSYSSPTTEEFEDIAFANVLSLSVKFYAIEDALRAKSFEDYDRGCRLVRTGFTTFVNAYKERALNGCIVLAGDD